jgi:hypothetical protein
MAHPTQPSGGRGQGSLRRYKEPLRQPERPSRPLRPWNGGGAEIEILPQQNGQTDDLRLGVLEGGRHPQGIYQMSQESLTHLR